MSEALFWVRKQALGLARELALGYAWIALAPSCRAGLVLAALTWLQPFVGAVGLLAALAGWGAAHLAGADDQERPVAVFNGLLCGLMAAHVWKSGASVVALAALGGVLCGWLSAVLGRLSGSMIGLAALSLPFTFVAMLTSAAGGSLSTLQYSEYVAPTAVFGGGIDAFLCAFGGLYFMPDPLVGACVLGVLLVFSRYYLMLALLGYGTAACSMQMLGAAPEHLASTGWLGNAMLSALLVGGLFASPSLVTVALAMLAALFAAWLSLGLGQILVHAQLMPYSMPFVLSVWLVLYAVVHNPRIAVLFNLQRPDFPERSYERTHIARSRLGRAGSVPLALAFAGTWTVSQGFSGEHTHRGLWRHALDFIVMKAGKSFANRGSCLEDFYCFGLPVLSPAYGQVWSVVNHVADNLPGAVNVVDNWGNYVVIRLANGKFVLLAHLRFASISVHPGAWVQPGDLLGQCGNSGRSAQPHLHLHVQIGPEPGSPTAPFHLASVMATPASGSTAPEAVGAMRYALSLVPAKGASVSAASGGDVRPFYLLAGRGLRYSVSRNGQMPQVWSVHFELDLFGRLQLVSSEGARCIAESNWAVFSCYERDGVPDPQFDLWLLACGYTPASTQVVDWNEQCTPARLLPGSGAQWASYLAWPWAAFAQSRYRRVWDAPAQGWRQSATHRQGLTGFQTRIEALLVPQLGCTALTARVGQDRIVFQAVKSFQQADLGVPAWESLLSPSVA